MGGLLSWRARTDALGSTKSVRRGVEWLERSAERGRVSHFHAEAGIAAEHCFAPSINKHRWKEIAETLRQVEPSPFTLAYSESGSRSRQWQEAEAGLAVLEGIAAASVVIRVHNSGTRYWVTCNRRTGHRKPPANIASGHWIRSDGCRCVSFFGVDGGAGIAVAGSAAKWDSPTTQDPRDRVAAPDSRGRGFENRLKPKTCVGPSRPTIGCRESNIVLIRVERLRERFDERIPIVSIPANGKMLLLSIEESRCDEHEAAGTPAIFEELETRDRIDCRAVPIG